MVHLVGYVTAWGLGKRRNYDMTLLARNTGITREALYRALSESGNPEFGTVLKVIHALDLQLCALPTVEQTHDATITSSPTRARAHNNT